LYPYTAGLLVILNIVFPRSRSPRPFARSGFLSGRQGVNHRARLENFSGPLEQGVK
jgi:hypothetical protein